MDRRLDLGSEPWFGVMAVALSPRLERSVPKRMVAAFLTVDPTVTMAMRERTDANARSTWWRIAPSMFAVWMVGIVLGLLLHNVLHDPKQWGLDAVLPTSLIALLAGLIRQGRDRVITMVGAAAITFAAIPNTAAGLPVLLALLAITIGVASRRAHP